MAVYHFCYRERRKEIFKEILKLDKYFDDMTYDQILKKIDEKDPEITKLKEVE